VRIEKERSWVRTVPLSEAGRSWLAVVTFDGAYAVLAYVAQEAAGKDHWLSAPEMMAGLGLAERKQVFFEQGRLSSRHSFACNQRMRKLSCVPLAQVRVFTHSLCKTRDSFPRNFSCRASLSHVAG
jgi:hypothetical protein